MRREILTVLLIFSLTNLSFAQSILEIFKSLPLEYTLELSNEAKASLMERGNYTFPGGDSIETMEAEFLAQKDFLRIAYYFTTGQSGFIVIELRKFQKIDGSLIVVYSKFGGTRRAFEQHSLLTFDYNNGTFKLNKNLGLPENIESEEFLKDNLPDSFKGDRTMLSYSFNLEPEETNGIAYEINSQTNQFDELIKTNRFLFIWNGTRFEKK